MREFVNHPDLGLILVTFWALTLFGVIYNALVAWLERKGYAEGFMALIVAAGCGVTLIGVAIISLPAAILSLGAFAASGTPMIIGSIVRYVKAREAEQQALRDEIRRKEQSDGY